MNGGSQPWWPAVRQRRVPNDLGRLDTPRENMALHGVSASGKALEFGVWT